MSKPNGFLVLTYPRCGTHMLKTLINRHPELRCRGEVFNPGCKEGRPRQPVKKKLQNVLRKPRSGAVAHMFHGWAGLAPVWHNDRDYVELFDVIPRDTTVVVLQRWNLLRRHVSHKRATKHKNWQISKSQKGAAAAASKIQITIDPEELRRDIDAIRQIQSTVGLAYPDSYILTYEQLCSDQNRQMYRIYEHLGVDPAHCPDPEPGTAKISKTPLADQVINYQQLKEHFAGSDLAVYFDE